MLKILNIKIKDFMCIKDVDLDFSNDKAILITGNNGEGKSTLIEAVAVCLSDNKRSKTYKEYIRLNCQKAFIELSATIFSEPILIKTTITESDKTREITYKGQIYKNSKSNTLIKDLSLDSYSDIIFAMQNCTSVVDYTPKKRSEYFQDIFSMNFDERVNELRNQNKNIKDFLLSNESKKQVLEKDLSVPVSLIKEKKFTLSRADIKKMTDEIKEAEEKVKENKANIDYNKVVDERISELENQKIKLSYENETLEKESEALNYYLAEKRKIEQLNSEYTQKLNVCITSKTELENKKKEILENLEKKTVELSEAEKDKNNAFYDYKTAKERLEKVNKGICPDCGREYNSSDKEQAQFQYETLMSLYHDKESEYNNTNDAYKNLLSSKEEITRNINTNSYDINDYEKNIKFNDEKLMELEKEIEDISGNKDKIKENEKTLKELDEKIIELSNSKKETFDIKSFLDKIHENNLKIIENNSITTFNEEAKNRNQIEIAKRQEKENELKQVEEKIKSDNERYALNKSIIEILSNHLPSYIIVKCCNIISSIMNNIIQVSFPYMEVNLVQKDGILIFYNPDTRKYNKMLNADMCSGFQKEIISIAFRCAVSEIYNLSFAFFDEIDSASSEENSIKMYEFLNNANLFEQFFIITHKKKTVEYIKNQYTNISAYEVSDGQYTKF